MKVLSNEILAGTLNLHRVHVPLALWKQGGPFSLVFFTYLILGKNRDLGNTWPKMHGV